MEHFRGFCTDIRQQPRNLAVWGGVPLGEVAHAGTHLAVRAAVLAHDDLRQLGVGFLDVYGKL